MAGWKRWYVLGAYMSLKDQWAVHWVEQALSRGPYGVEMLLVRYLNSCLVQPRYQREEYMETAIVYYGLVDQSLHFIPRRGVQREGRMVM